MALEIPLKPDSYQEISDLTDYPVEELQRIFLEAKRLGQTYVFVVEQHEVHIAIDLGEGASHEEERQRGSVSRGGLHLLRYQEEEASEDHEHPDLRA